MVLLMVGPNVASTECQTCGKPARVANIQNGRCGECLEVEKAAYPSGAEDAAAKARTDDLIHDCHNGVA